MGNLEQQSNVYEKGRAPGQYIIHEQVAALTRDVETLFQYIENLHIKVTRLSSKLEEQAKEIKILELKNKSSLANNLCPDHRDKQAGKSCLACEIERKDKEITRKEEGGNQCSKEEKTGNSIISR